MARTSIFSDRRDRSDRRKQQLPMPAGQNRRLGSRRDGKFHSSSWWLKVDYSIELVSEKECAEQLRNLTNHKKPQNKQDLKSKK